jgi:hypothetical protein
MNMDFTPDRWDKISQTYRMWWDGKLERPIIPVILEDEDYDDSGPEAPFLSQSNCHELSIPAGKLLDRIEFEFAKNVYLGDAYPYFSMDCFGPGIISAFLGARLDNSTGRVWFHPKKLLPIKEIHFEYDVCNIWLNRIKEICHEAVSRWQGRIMLGMPDLGGPIDILSTFRPGENLLYDLYDYPEEVIRLVWELHELWHRYFRELNDILLPVNHGYTNWCSVFCDKPFYILQADASYMMSPEMFSEFIKPELEATSQRLQQSLYHMDGIGQLNHLDSLLDLSELNGIQWVPGEGKPGQSEWPDIFRKISQRGKGMLLFYGLDSMDAVAEQIGTYKGLINMAIRVDISQEAEYRKRLKKYGLYGDLS